MKVEMAVQEEQAGEEEQYHGDGDGDGVKKMNVWIRVYEEGRDNEGVERVERVCEASASLFTDLMGDPLCRLRHFPSFSMMVAEVEMEDGHLEIAGMIRAGVKEVNVCAKTSDSSSSESSPPSSSSSSSSSESSSTSSSCDEYNEAPSVSPTFVCTAYILGLRVAPQYRRLGIAVALVKKMEAWCREQGAVYAYIATEKDNEASVNLFTKRLDYHKFRTPTILVQPIYAKPKRLNPRVKIVEVKQHSESLYREVFGHVEFFPKDVDAIMRSKLHKGTWMATWRDEEDVTKCEEDGHGHGQANHGHGQENHHGHVVLDQCHRSWAMLSIWKCNEIFKLQVKGASWRVRGMVSVARLLGRIVPGVVVPTPPDVFRPFGLHLAYGLHAHGDRSTGLLTELFWFAHNLAKKDGCAVLATELASRDPVLPHVPHWSSLSCEEDLWCIKCLTPPSSSSSVTSIETNWCKTLPPTSIFVDPRDF